MASDLRRALTSVPDARPVDDQLDAGIADSVAYLGSDAARRAIETDVYWPKWEAPWWHMLLLHELGLARRIPDRAVAAMVAGLKALPLKRFPIRPEETPDEESLRKSHCHCSIGSIHQVLAACGVDVDAELPWMVEWFRRFQMADGGLNCDSTAYLVEGECPSSMVGTVAPFEAMLAAGDDAFLDRAAGFLVARELRLGSPSVHNAVERTVAPIWLRMCFPRFYFYDVLRGLAALVRWAERRGRTVPARAVADVVEHLVAAFPDGVVHLQRLSTASCPATWRQTDGGAWTRQPTGTFPLLEAASALGRPSAVLTREWAEARRGLLAVLA